MTIAAVAAAMFSVASCSDSGSTFMKKATSGFDLNLPPAAWNVGGYYGVAYQTPDGENIFEVDQRTSDYGYHPHLGLFHDGHAVVSFEKMLAVINTDGEIVVDLSDYYICDWSDCFVSENRIMAQRRGTGSFACFDMDGNEIFEMEGYMKSQLRAGYALYADKEYGEKYGVINAKGEVVFEAGQDEYINKHYIMVMSWPESYSHPTWFPVYNDEGFAYILDVATGKHYLEDIATDYSWYLCPMVDCNDRIIVCSDRKLGLIDLEGNTIIEPQYYHLRNDGEWYSYTEDGHYGWLDKDGKVMIEAQYEGYSIRDFCYFGTSDWAPVDPHTFINRKGEMVLESDYVLETGFIGDRCIVDLGREGYAWMDREGNLVGSLPYMPERTCSDIRRLATGKAIQY